MRTFFRLLLFCFALSVMATAGLAQDNMDGIAEGAAGLGACAACSGFFLFIFLGLLALNIALLVWVTRDARNRGTENAVLWLIVVLIAGPIGLIVYFLSRPKGNLVVCPKCQGKRLEFSAKCPHCGNA
jgi:hypothetical protein